MDPSWPMRICPQTSELAHVANTRSKDGFKINFHTLNISGNQESHRGKPSLLGNFHLVFHRTRVSQGPIYGCGCLLN